MLYLRIDLEDLKKLGLAIGRLAVETQRMVHANPPRDRTPTAHPEFRRMTAEFDGATEVVRKAADTGFMTAAQYRRIARHFEVVAEAIERGADREEATAKRDAASIKRGVAVAAVRKPRARRR